MKQEFDSKSDIGVEVKMNVSSKEKDSVKKESLDPDMFDIDKTLSTDDKVKEQNRIRQLAFKARAKMPKDYKSFCLVAEHLMRNAHRYYQGNSALVKKDDVKKEDPESKCTIKESLERVEVSSPEKVSQMEVNKCLVSIRA